jgi:hypothetical protein
MRNATHPVHAGRRFDRRVWLLAFSLACGVSCWVPVWLHSREGAQSLTVLKTKLHAVEQAISAARSAVNQSKNRLAETNRRNEILLSWLRHGEKELARVDPESLWVNPPAALPEWNPDSPYVWIPKAKLTVFPLTAFEADGSLKPEIGTLFTLPPDAQSQLNARLTRAVADYRTVEREHVERIDEHFAGVAEGEGPKVTLRVNPIPEEGRRLRLEFEAALSDALGRERSDLARELSSYWFDSTFGEETAKTISVARNASGTYRITVKTQNVWRSTGGNPRLDGFVPQHLQPMFMELLDASNN